MRRGPGAPGPNPAATAPARGTAAKPATTDAGDGLALDLAQVRVVVLDPDPDYRQLTVGELKSLGMAQVRGVGEPRDVLAAIGGRGVDVLITEWFVDLVRFLRTHPKSPARRLPIIVASTRAHAGDIAAARDLGVHAYVAKPVSAADLYQHVATVLRHPRRFIEGPTYTGPDRRRPHPQPYHGPERRRTPAGTGNPDGGT